MVLAICWLPSIEAKWMSVGRPRQLRPYIISSSCCSMASAVNVSTSSNAEKQPKYLSKFPSEGDAVIMEENISQLLAMYNGSFRCCSIPKYPKCKILLCGTVHIGNFSSSMVESVINSTNPNFVLIELCAERLDGVLCDDSGRIDNMTLLSVIKSGWSERSLKSFASGLFCWMQSKAAQSTNSHVGAELRTAVAAAEKVDSPVILGDRLYSVTIQRIFDQLRWWSKVKLFVHIVFEILAYPMHSFKEFVRNSENNQNFINDEIHAFLRQFPDLARVVITERDCYLAASIAEVAALSVISSTDTVVVAVVGAGHVPGIARHMESNCRYIPDDHLAMISSSSKHCRSTWPGKGRLSVLPREWY
jgi:pheromone shutdown protein TraB